MSPSPSIEPNSGAYSPVQFLFVYGTLRRAYMLLPHQLRRMRPPHILDTHGKWVGTGVLREHELWDLGSYPGLLKGKHGEVVLGDVYSVQTSAWEELDRYEGIAPEYESPQEYLREVSRSHLFFEEG